MIYYLAAQDQYHKRNRGTEVPRFPRNCYFCSMTAYTDPYRSLSLNSFLIQMVYRISVTASMLNRSLYTYDIKTHLLIFSKNGFLLNHAAKIVRGRDVQYDLGQFSYFFRFFNIFCVDPSIQSVRIFIFAMLYARVQGRGVP